MKRRRNLGKGKQGSTGAANLFISHRRCLSGQEKGFVMKNSSRLMAAVAPLALMGAVLVPATVVQAAETATARPIPKIRIPTTPAQIEKTPRLLTQTPTPDAEKTEPEEERVRVDTAEETPTASIRKRIGTQRIESTTPAEVENKLRVRTRVLTPVEEDVAAEPPPPRRVRVGASQVDNSPAEIDNTQPTRIRVAQPVDGSADERAAPTRRRIGTPGVGGIQASLPDGPIRSVGSAQSNCLFRGDRNLKRSIQRPTPGSTALLEMVCISAGKPTLTTFRYDVPTEKFAATALSDAQKNDEAKLSSLISFVPNPLTEAAGRPVYQLLNITAGDNDRQRISCIDGNGALVPKNSGNEDDQGNLVEKWCSNGNEIAPRSFQVNSWLQPANLSVSISTAGSTQSTKGGTGVGVEYHLSTGTTDSGSFLVRPSASAGALASDIGCTVQSDDPGSLYCSSKPINGIATTYLAYSPPEVRQHLGVPWAPKCETKDSPIYDDVGFSDGNGGGGSLGKFIRYYDYKTVTCDTPKIAYRLLPGKVPTKHRGQTKGGCYLASWAGYISEKVVKITYSRAVEATKTGSGIDINGNPTAIIVEGKTISTNGTIDPSSRTNIEGKRVSQTIKTVNAPCN